jgi:hypothetical protein
LRIAAGQRDIAHAFGNAISPLLGATFIANAFKAVSEFMPR